MREITGSRALGPRPAAVQALWYALRDSGKPGTPTLGQRATALPIMMWATLTGRYVGMSRGRLAFLALAGVYIISPIDAVPEAFLALLGLGDDALVGTWLAGALIAETGQYLSSQTVEPSAIEGEVA